LIPNPTAVEEGECDVLCERNGEEKLLATLGQEAYFGEMALLSNRRRSATLRARTAMDVVIIPKSDFNKLSHSAPAFGNVFTELAARRTEAESPHVSADPGMLGCLPGIPRLWVPTGPMSALLALIKIKRAPCEPGAIHT
jgi:CRP-like cAMP-binding protein